MNATLEEATKFFRDITEIFPGARLDSIKITQGDEQMAFFNFSKEEVQESTGFELLPAGKYTAMVSNHEWKPTKSGHMLVLTFEITGPDHAGRKVFEQYNLDNPSDQAVQIAMQGVKALCLAAESEDYLDAMFAAADLDAFVALIEELPQALYNRPIEISVKVEKSKDPQYGDKNRISGYSVIKTAAAPPKKSTPPAWGKKAA